MIHSSIRSRIGFAAWAVLVGSMGVAAAESLAGDAIEFNRDVRPILNEHCIKCHGPDSVSRKANLRLDDPKSALASEAVVPGDPEASLLVERIESKDPEQVMPPPKSGKALKPDERRILQEWVRQGGKYQPLWSFIPPVRSKPPEVKTPGWVRNPIDQFVLAKLEESKLTPAPEADRRTLARRLSLDIVGLPPDPAEVDRFVADTSSDAYEKYVDRLLDSPHYGEHRARYWLDAARYADSHGIHFDNYREMWSYRDWVIQAFNGNMPFDRFTIEQIAGDLLPNRTLDQQIASGFNRCNITTNEGGVIAEEYLVHYTRDRTETVSAVFMGLTANCAVCHDHKFDPLSQKEFYEMAAFFNNTTQGAMDGNIKDTPPIVFVPSSVDRSRWNALTGEIAAVNAKVDERKKTAKPEFESWLKDAKRETIAATLPTAGLRLHARLDEVNPTLDSAKKGGRKSSGSLVLADAGDFERNQAFSFGAWVNLGRQDGSGAIIARMDEGAEHRGWDLWVENFKIGSHVISKWPGNALKVVSRNQLKPLEWNHVFVTYDGSSKVEGLKVYVNGVLQPVDVQASTLTDTIRTKVPLQVGKRSTGAGLPGLSAQDLRIYDRALADEEIRKLSIDAKAGWLVAKPPAERKAEEVEELFGWWLRSTDSASRDLSAQLAKLETEKAAIQGRGTIAHVMQEKPEEAMAFILHRGEYDKRRDPVKPSTPAVLPPMPKDFPRNRLGFARWLLLPEHPLTARVTVNRIWQEIFGAGLVRSSGDFGINGEMPSHPELLDWLAVDFRENGWNIKAFIKQVVCSATYRQSSSTTPEKVERDPQNRLLARGPRFRMDAEAVRDSALAVSGLLSPKLGGPSVKPYQPEGVWEAVAMIGSNTRDYRADSGDALYRRSLYTFWKRSAPPASMEIFNAPNRETCTVRRERTNTPLQALVTLNDPQFVEAARKLAEVSLAAGGGDFSKTLDAMARRLVSRSFRPEEVAVIRASFDDLSAFYKGHPKEAGELLAVGASKPSEAFDRATLAGWTMLANQLMNLDEVINK